MPPRWQSFIWVALQRAFPILFYINWGVDYTPPNMEIFEKKLLKNGNFCNIKNIEKRIAPVDSMDFSTLLSIPKSKLKNFPTSLFFLPLGTPLAQLRHLYAVPRIFGTIPDSLDVLNLFPPFKFFTTKLDPAPGLIILKCREQGL